MITDKQIKERIEKAHLIAVDTLKPKEEIDEIFNNLKAHLQANKSVERAITLINDLLVKHGEATIRCEKKENEVEIMVGNTKLPPIPKHFDFDVSDLYYTTLDFFAQIYEEGKFFSTLIFLCEDQSKAEVHVNL